jgi:uncharacterized protein
VVFKRRTPRSYRRVLAESFWPKGGWARAASYVWHRVRRLPDAPHRIARGVFAGIFISFLPLFGLHFVGAALIAWVIRGNILASLLATFVGNPITFPLIAWSALETGYFMIGGELRLSMARVAIDFGMASQQIWQNFLSVFGPEPANWDRLSRFWREVFWPYFLGGIPTGIVAGIVGYYLTLPLLGAYQAARKTRLVRRLELRRALELVRAAELAEVRRRAAEAARTGENRRDGEGKDGND